MGCATSIGCDLPGDAAHAAVAAQVDSYHVEGKDKDRLVVNLSHKAMGRVALAVQLQKDLREPNLLTATGKTADIPLTVPQVAPSAVEHATGRLVIFAPEGLRVNPDKTEGLRSISFKEAAEGTAAAPREPSARGRPVLAFAFTQEPITLRLAVQRRKPQVNLQQLLVGRIEQGVVKYQATFHYNILYSGVKSLRIDVPTAVVGPRLAQQDLGHPRQGHGPAAGQRRQGLLGLEFQRRSGIAGQGRHRAGLGGTDQEARCRQERRSRRAAAGAAGRRFARLGPDRADQGGNA